MSHPPYFTLVWTCPHTFAESRIMTWRLRWCSLGFIRGGAAVIEQIPRITNPSKLTSSIRM